MTDRFSSHQGGQTPLILFATPPLLQELQALTIHIPSANQNAARFQPQVIKCREFIFTEPGVIGSPSPDIIDHTFHLIASASLVASGKLQNRLTRIGLQVSSPYEVQTELYQACLRYTIIARLSPNWNKAGVWLVQGRDFLTIKGCVNAVKMDVAVVHDELYFTLEAAMLRISPMQVTDLDIVGKSLDHYLTHPGASLEKGQIASDWCYILPSMKRGRIASISHEIPEDSPFTMYRDLKRHWKNTYGYRLPETDEGINFYQIHFGKFGGKLFTYPFMCLRPRELQRVSRVDPKPILRAFIIELQAKFPTVCGLPIKLQTKAKFTVNDLLSVNQIFVLQVEKQPNSNLTSKMTGSRQAVYRSKTEMNTIFTTQNIPATVVQSTHPSMTNSSRPVTEKHINNGSIRNISSEKSSSISVRPPTANATPSQKLSYLMSSQGLTSSSSINCQTPQSTIASSNNQEQTMMRTATPLDKETMVGSQNPKSQTVVARKLFPSFKPKTQMTACTVMAQSQSASAAKLIPTFTARKPHNQQSKMPAAQGYISLPRSTTGVVNPSQLSNSQLVSSNQIGCSQQTGHENKTIPLFQKVKPSSMSSMTEPSTLSKKPSSSKAKSKVVSASAKTGKPTKRSKDKVPDQEKKRIKKLKKAEA
ncbi:uncharacterized protein C18orf63-like [Mya arenaria]|uniref:uncharacterized protein C18orf63-like n=1 Tax=Mya arenaria TaxID=6604 RepID=UPI0022E8A52C|nr:uncharacterized protein C18orf63-like [Mya arenaria]